jgi:hypothetical protein
MRNHLALALLLAISSGAVACAQDIGPDGELTDESGAPAEGAIITRISGSKISSVYANPNATYLSVRSLDTLGKVGALEGVVGALARRADGIIANQPADGRVSVKELLRLEKPDVLKTLFPQEKAALPQVWELLETVTGQPTVAPNLTALPTLQVTDVSTPPGTLTPPKTLTIASLHPDLQSIARRVELSYDADNDDATIAPSDLASALAKPGPYTPAELAQIKQIQSTFAARATSSYRAVAQVTAPFAKSTSLGTFGGVSLSVEDSVFVTEERTMDDNRGRAEQFSQRLYGGVARTVKLDATGDVKVVLVYEKTEKEVVVDASNVSLQTGTTTLEVWSNGARKSAHRVRFTKDLSTSAPQYTDMDAWRGYELVAGGKPLFRNTTSATKERDTWNWGVDHLRATYAHEVAAAPAPQNADPEALAWLAFDSDVPAGRYVFAVPKVGNCTVDIALSGAVWLTPPFGAAIRGRVSPRDYSVDDPNWGIHMSIDTSGNYAFTSGGYTVLQGRVTGAERTG